MSAAGATAAVTAAAQPRTFGHASSSTAAAALGRDFNAFSVFAPSPASAALKNRDRTPLYKKSPSDSRSDLRLTPDTPPTQASERAGTSRLPLNGSELPSPWTTTKGSMSKTSVQTAAAAASVQQHWIGESASNHASNSLDRGSGSCPTTPSGTRRHHALSPAKSTPVTEISTRSNGWLPPLGALSAASALGDKDGERLEASGHPPTGQHKQQHHLQNRGAVSVYAKREKILNFTMQTLQQQVAVAALMGTHRQQPRTLLQEQLPCFFPAEQEGEQSEEGKKLHMVLAFQQYATITAAAAASSARNGEPLDWRKATAAMVAFGLPRDVQRTLREGSRQYEEADAYVLRMLAGNACRREETPSEQRFCMQRIISRRLRHQRNLWKQTVALERALQARQSAAEDIVSSGTRSEKSLQLDEVLSYKQRLEREILRHCYGVIWTATHLLKPFAASVAARLFVHQTIAAAYRQATQFTTSISQFQCLKLARDNYEVAVELVKSDDNFGPCDVTRLEVLTSWAIFLFYNLKEQELALQEARLTLQEALHRLPMVKDDKNFKEVVEALRTLMRNIRRWMQETQKDAVFDWWTG